MKGGKWKREVGSEKVISGKWKLRIGYRGWESGKWEVTSVEWNLEGRKKSLAIQPPRLS